MFAHKYQIRVEMDNGEKLSRLLCRITYYDRKKFYSIGPRRRKKHEPMPEKRSGDNLIKLLKVEFTIMRHEQNFVAAGHSTQV
jgi:hypothetical protein